MKREQKDEYSFEELKEIIAELRGEQGCPWDREQTFESLKKCLRDETEEVFEAVDHQDMENLCEELGDVLLQVMLYSQIAAEKGQFTVQEVISGLCRKLIRRHPHVFGDATARNAEEALALWKEAKRLEKERKSQELLDK